MDTVLRSMKSWDRSLNDVTRLCLAATSGCFLVGGLFMLADYLIPLGPRGIALVAVGFFFLVHGLVEFAKQRWQVTASQTSDRSKPEFNLGREAVFNRRSEERRVGKECKSQRSQ